MGRWRARVDAFAAHADLVKVSAEDLAALHPDLDEAEAAARWRGMGVALVVVTHGAAGSVAYGPFGEARASAPAVTVVDTVGAGDSFIAALMAALEAAGRATPAGVAALTQADAGAALGYAARAAALTCSRRGADTPRRAELDALS
jgi:fructokinase